MFLKEKKGVILIACYLVIVVLTILGGAFLLRSISEKKVAERERDSIQAFYLAEAALNEAIWYLRNVAPDGSADGSWRTTAYPTDPGDDAKGSLENIGTYTMWVQESGILPGWTHRKKITIEHTKVLDTDQSNFPVLIHTKDSAWKDTDNGGRVAQSDGADILFTSSGGTLSDKLDHEIEDYDETTGELIAWVEVPTVSASTDTVIYIYYGNATCSNQENPAGVWDSNFKGVWHLKEDPSGTAPQMLDSTSNDYDGNTGGSMTSVDQVTGQVNGSLDFDGTDDYVRIADDPFDFSTGSFTISAWIKGSKFDHDCDGIVAKWTDSDYTGWSLFKNRKDHHDPLNKPNHIGFKTGDSEGVRCSVFSDGAIHKHKWYYVSAVVDRVFSLQKLYIPELSDDILQDQDDISALESLNNATVLDIGREDGVHSWDGLIDEVRISDVARSAGWIATSFNSQKSPSRFYDVESEATIYARGTAGGLSRTIQAQIKIEPNKIRGAVYSNGEVKVNFESRDVAYIDGGVLAGIYATGETKVGRQGAGHIFGNPPIEEEAPVPDALEDGLWDAFDCDALKAQAIAEGTYFSGASFNTGGRTGRRGRVRPAKYTLPVDEGGPTEDVVYFFDTQGNGQWDAAEDYTDSDGNEQWDPGEDYTDSDGDGEWDTNEPYTDSDGDGRWDAGEDYTDSDGNEQWDPGEDYTDSDGDGHWDAGEPYTDIGVVFDDDAIDQNKEANVELKGTCAVEVDPDTGEPVIDPDTGEPIPVPISGVIVVVGDLKILDTPVYDFLFDGLILVLDDLKIDDKRHHRRGGTNNSDILIKGAVLNDNIIQEGRGHRTKKGTMDIKNATIEYDEGAINRALGSSGSGGGITLKSWQEVY